MFTKKSKNKAPLILLDNCFLEQYCYQDPKITPELGEELIKKRWDRLIESILVQLPNFENDYEIIYTPLCMFESIKFGSFNNKLSSEQKKELLNCFPIRSDFLISKKIFESSTTKPVKILDAILVKTFDKLIEFYKNALSVEDLISSINKKLKTKLHPNVLNLQNFLSEYKDDLIQGKNSILFQTLCRDLSWDAIVKYEKWITPDSKNDPKYVECLESLEEFIILSPDQIRKRIVAFYIKYNSENYPLSGSVLIMKDKKEKPRPYKLDRELLDPYLIDYAFNGFYDQKSKIRKKVIIITCEKNQKKMSQTIFVAKIK